MPNSLLSILSSLFFNVAPLRPVSSGSRSSSDIRGLVWDVRPRLELSDSVSDVSLC